MCTVNVTVPRVKVLLISNVLFWTLELWYACSPLKQLFLRFPLLTGG